MIDIPLGYFKMIERRKAMASQGFYRNDSDYSRTDVSEALQIGFLSGFYSCEVVY